MNNCVSYEIALKLKAAGFPEPHQLMSSDIEFYAYNPRLSWIKPWIITLPLCDYHVFAPTISDILPLIAGSVYQSPVGNYFACDMMHFHGQIFKSKNIHDAAAMGWLHVNQSK